MKNITVLEMMIPIAEYATVSDDATLYEAILSLGKARTEYKQTSYQHRAFLVYDKNDQIMGKLNQMDIIKAFEPDYTKKLGKAHLSRFGISDRYVESILKEHDSWNEPFDQLCSAASHLKVADIMYFPTEGEYIRSEASFQEAVHRLILGHHHSLLVIAGDDTVGAVRLPTCSPRYAKR
jgi:hypothetical protein